MAAEIITTDDLRELEIKLLERIEKLFKQYHGQPTKRWLKTYEVRKMLGISPGSLQNLRVNGSLPYIKINGAIYYAYEDIEKLFEKNRIHQPCKALRP